MTASALLKSCATPLARRPIASIFCACRSCASRWLQRLFARRRSVTSRMMAVTEAGSRPPSTPRRSARRETVSSLSGAFDLRTPAPRVRPAGVGDVRHRIRPRLRARRIEQRWQRAGPSPRLRCSRTSASSALVPEHDRAVRVGRHDGVVRGVGDRGVSLVRGLQLLRPLAAPRHASGSGCVVMSLNACAIAIASALPEPARRRSHSTGGHLARDLGDVAQRTAHATAQHDCCPSRASSEHDGAGPGAAALDDVVDEALAWAPSPRAESASPTASWRIAGSSGKKPLTNGESPIRTARHRPVDPPARPISANEGVERLPDRRARTLLPLIVFLDDERDLAARDLREIAGHLVVEPVRRREGAEHLVGEDRRSRHDKEQPSRRARGWRRAGPRVTALHEPVIDCRRATAVMPATGAREPASHVPPADVTTQNAAERSRQYSSAITSIVSRSDARSRVRSCRRERPGASRSARSARAANSALVVMRCVKRGPRGAQVVAGAVERVLSHDPTGDEATDDERTARRSA